MESEEQQYIDLLTNVLQHGHTRNDRTGTGTISLFAPPQLRFSLSNTNNSSQSSQSGFERVLPLLTTKRVHFKSILLELLWFLRGHTDSKTLSKQGVKIWDGNGSREFLDKRGLKDNEEGDLGPVYGWQWRRFGGKYGKKPCDELSEEELELMEEEMEKEGAVDQVTEVVRLIREDPYSRRIILSAWNPKDLPQMALPPCHMFCQFYVTPPQSTSSTQSTTTSSQPSLSLLLYLRSSDLGLGLPFNIASYALLGHIISHLTDTRPGELVVQLGDAHIYRNHIEPLKSQTQRQIQSTFPTLSISQIPSLFKSNHTIRQARRKRREATSKKGGPEENDGVQQRGDSKGESESDGRENWTIDDYSEEDFILENYTPQKGIKMEMSV